jgi:hypothetical protein
MMHLKLLEKQEQTKLKTNRQREMIKIRSKINKIGKYIYKELKNHKVGSSKRLLRLINFYPI